MKRVVKGSSKSSVGRARTAGAARAGKAAPAGRKMVWRVSPEHPEGTWVDSSRTPLSPAATHDPLAEQESWTTSTMDLLDGVEIVEGAEDTIPAELLEELFETKPKPPAK